MLKNPTQKSSDRSSTVPLIEWPTFATMIACYSGWMLGTTVLAEFNVMLGVLVTGVCVALHSSLQHEVFNGHPFRNKVLSELSVYPALGLLIPYQRFRDTHLVHHFDAELTDPYDDPETNFLDPEVWATLSRPLRVILTFNASLMGRMIVGPVIAQVLFVKADIRVIYQGDKTVLLGWAHHLVGGALVLYWVCLCRRCRSYPIFLRPISAFRC